MTPAQRAAARTAYDDAVTDLINVVEEQDMRSAGEWHEVFLHHTEVLAGHLALAFQPDPDPFEGLTGPDAVGADPTASTPPEGPTP